MSAIAVMVGTTQTRPTAGGWETLLFGIVLSVIGIPFATNYRGCLDRWANDVSPTPATLKRLPPWKWFDPNPKTTARIVTTAFAILGPLLILLGIARIAAGNP
jgi:uncharacterized membrane protein